MGFGFLLSNEQAGAGSLNRIQFMGQAAHNLRLGRRLNLRTGMQLGFGARSIDVTNLVFTDQLLRDNTTRIGGARPGGRNAVHGHGGRLYAVVPARLVWRFCQPFGHAQRRPEPGLARAPGGVVHWARRRAHRLARGPQAVPSDVVLSWKYIQQGDRNQLDVGAYRFSLFTWAFGTEDFPFSNPQTGLWMWTP